MNAKPLLALLALLPLLVSFPAGAVPSSFTFADTDAVVPYSWGTDGDLNNVTRTGILSEDWDITGIAWSGTASPNDDADFTLWSGVFGATTGSDLYVNIMLGTLDLGNFQLGSGGALLPNTAFANNSSFATVSGLSGDIFSFRFFEQTDNWGLINASVNLVPPSSYDALWNTITFSLNGSAPVPFCTSHPNDPSCVQNPPNPNPSPNPAPEPATLALLGLGLAGLGLMRRRTR